MKEESHRESHDSKGSPPSKCSIVFSIITHLLLLVPVIYIIALAFQNYDFFAWHPICMSLGAGLLIMEAVYSISGEAIISKKVSRSSRIMLHWLLHSVGIILLIIGLVITIVNKNIKGYDHFVTFHSIFGLVTFVITCLVALFGILANNARWFYPKVRPVLLKVIHSYGGILLVVLLLATVINGTYNSWWSIIEASESARSLAFASFVIAGVFILVKPIIGAVARTKVLMNPPPQIHNAADST